MVYVCSRGYGYAYAMDLAVRLPQWYMYAVGVMVMHIPWILQFDTPNGDELTSVSPVCDEGRGLGLGLGLGEG